MSMPSESIDSIDSARSLLTELNNPSAAIFDCESIRLSDKETTIPSANLSLFRIDKITFEEDAPRQEALENVLATMSIPGINIVYLIEGTKDKVNFYFGVAKDYTALKPINIPIKEIGKHILMPSLKGNFRGSEICETEDNEINRILNNLNNAPRNQVLEGIPGINQNNNKKAFQGIDRLVDVMAGNPFYLLIIAKPIVDMNLQNDLYGKLCNLHSVLAPLVKISRQEGKSRSNQTTHGTSVSIANGNSSQTGTNSSTTRGTNESNSDSEGSSSSSSSSTKGTSESGTEGTSSSNSTTYQKTDGSNESTSENTGSNSSASFEQSDKSSQDWLKYLDDILFPRMDYAKGKGLYIAACGLFSASNNVLLKLANTIKSVFSGEAGNRIPFHVVPDDMEAKRKAIQNFQLPFSKPLPSMASNELLAAIANSKCLAPVKCTKPSGDRRLYCGCWMSSRELGVMAGIPQKEVVGLKLTEEVEFGLNVKSVEKQSDAIILGKLVQSGQILDSVDVFLQKDYLDKHIFVAGVTGSGKTTTCKRLLLESKLPFMVIEPAKTEYRSLMNSLCPDLLVFTLGDETSAPFRLNPFEFLPGENITSRVDMIKATIEAAFDMEAAIPQIIEAAIYDCYIDKGWNINTNKNSRYENPFADGVFAFPTLQEMIDKCDEVVKRMNFDTRLKNDYIGSIKARLNGLLLGAKGAMLNCRRSLDFEKLLDRKIVLEMEEIRSGSEKSLIMGFILTNHFVAIKRRFDTKGKQAHITLIEEAHRLLSKYEPGDSLNKKHGVETFADMLAEIRKYGESLIIVDQIPNKMTPEVLKNTNTKIVHRLFAKDDKDTIGCTMSLSEDQCNFLSNLKIGRSIVFNGDWDKPIQVQITGLSKEDESPLEKRMLRKKVMEIYASNYKRGILGYTEFLTSEPTIGELEKHLERIKAVLDEFNLIWEKDSEPTPEMIPGLMKIREKSDTYRLDCLIQAFFNYKNINLEEKRKHAMDMLDSIANGNSENFLKDLRMKFKN